MSNTAETAVSFRKVTKTFGGKVIANKDVDLDVHKGEILSLLGENGSGKTTLMNMLAGIYFPDSGHIYINGKEVVIKSPKDAFDLGIGMVHQEFSLIPGFSAAENIVLNREPVKKNVLAQVFGERMNTLDYKEISDQAANSIEKLGVSIDKDMTMNAMPVGHKQFTEIARELLDERLVASCHIIESESIWNWNNEMFRSR